MSSRRTRGLALAAAAAASAVAVALAAPAAFAHPLSQGNGGGNGHHGVSRHVLLLSVDGLHESDLAFYVKARPDSALAQLVSNGVDYTGAKTTLPSDSFPGMVAQLTGAGPGTSGVYYDDTFNHALLPPGTLNCSDAALGTEVAWTEAADRSQNPITLDAGENLPGSALAALPTNSLAQTLAEAPALTSEILKMTPNAQALLNPAALPVDPATCLPIYPHNYLRVNTVFNVVRAAGGRTAWSDKHPAYEILNGPSGTGVQDLFTPEINSVADAAGDDWTTDNALTMEYDNFKVQAILNEINGFDHSGAQKVGTPAIFGMNFQTVSTGEKLPVSEGLKGGYNADGTPGPLLMRSLDYVSNAVGEMLQRIRDDGLASSTTIILSAKHGQSPIDPNLLRRVDDSKILSGLDAAWTAAHPGAGPLVAFAVDDDAMLIWLTDHSPAALAFAKNYLLTHSAPANTINDPKGTFSTTVAASGLTKVFTGADADKFLGARVGDTHAPDIFGVAQHGVVYTGGVSKIAEHGGAADDDRDVALVVSGAGVRAGRTISGPVLTTQIAPTILQLLGLDPRALDAVRQDHTRALPGL
jgi:hypothetical protein